MLHIVEKFLKQVLRHYHVDVAQVTIKQLLHAQERLFYRGGRMLQAWPQGDIKVQQGLARIEEKHRAELITSGALAVADKKMVYTPPRNDQDSRGCAAVR